MIRPFGKWEDQAFAVARFVIGALYACHGAQKLFGVLGGAKELHDPLGLTAGIIEFFGGAMIALGLAARVAAFVASGEMAVAYFMAHASHGFWPIRNGGERAVFYCFFFLFVGARGSGRFSTDTLFARGKHR